LSKHVSHPKPVEAPPGTKKFISESNTIAFDMDHRRKIRFNMGKYYAAVEKGLANYADLPLARNRAGHLKWQVLESLDLYLQKFEVAFTARGGKVIWAATAEDAVREILAICQRHNTKSVV